MRSLGVMVIAEVMFLGLKACYPENEVYVGRRECPRA